MLTINDGIDALPILQLNLVRVTAMSQLAECVHSDVNGLSYLEPKLSSSTKHGVWMTNGVAGLEPRKEVGLLDRKLYKGRASLA